MKNFDELDKAGKISYVGWLFLIFAVFMVIMLAFLEVGWQLLAMTAAGPVAVWLICQIIYLVMRSKR